MKRSYPFDSSEVEKNYQKKKKPNEPRVVDLV